MSSRRSTQAGLCCLLAGLVAHALACGGSGDRATQGSFSPTQTSAVDGGDERDDSGVSSPSEDASSSPADGAISPTGDAGTSSVDASPPASDAEPPTDTGSPDATTGSDTSPSADDTAAPMDTATPIDTSMPPPGPSTACSPLPAPSGATVSSPPLIAHWERPADPNVVVLTFDDGPDEAGVTDRVLDILKAEGLHAAFFVNTRTTGTLTASATMQRTLARIIAEGHEVGNHTAHHPDLATLSAAGVESELATVEADVAAIATALPCAPTWSLARAPFGSPYLSGTAEQLDTVSHVMGKHGVHVGWSIESLDWDCQGMPGCADEWKNRVLYRVDLGRRGPILMHSTVKETADALPSLITALRTRGVTFGTVEGLVRAKYGKSSAQLVVDYRASHP
jgi:peptidoglycan/xylan/chitin deacetylase (PgdA/CDA1 family)